jgi:tRNA-modifying protein YgfZ
VGPEQGAFFDLSSRVKLRVSGSDRLRYVNGQVSNDVRKARETDAVHACVLTAKGKVNADVFIRTEGDALLIDSDAELREALPARLERYVIADDVAIEDVTEVFALLHVIGPNVPALALPHVQVRADRFGCAGVDLWIAGADREVAVQELSRALPHCGNECAETFRIERGIPRWGYELTEEIIPTEANLERAAIDYSKGCYIGQEVISRIKMSGQTNKRLCGLLAACGTSVRAEMRLLNPADGKEVGWVTSVASSARLGRQIALGYLKRGFQTPGLQLSATAASGETATAEVAALPFI